MFSSSKEPNFEMSSTPQNCLAASLLILVDMLKLILMQDKDVVYAFLAVELSTKQHRDLYILILLTKRGYSRKKFYC